MKKLMALIAVTGFVILSFNVITASFVEAAQLSSGTYSVEVNAPNGTYTAYWMIKVDGSNISGMSDWKALHGFQKFIHSLKGTVSGNRVTIIRNCAEPEQPSCKQTYTGTIRTDVIEGNWSAATGGGGTWKLFLNRPLE
jgi:hypothetical protein